MNHYFYIDAAGKQKGTFTPDELRKENIRRDTLVWTQGMEQWVRAEELDDLREIFESPLVEPPRYFTEARQEPVSITQKPKSWLIESILVTLLPFLLCGSFLSLIGIVAIVNATQVDSHFARGDFRASEVASKSAEKWTKISFWIFIGWVVLAFISIILIISLLGLTLSGLTGIMFK